MTREELIKHWEGIVESVLAAETNLCDELKKIIKSKNSAIEKKKKYINTIATEIVSKTTDEEISKM